MMRTPLTAIALSIVGGAVCAQPAGDGVKALEDCFRLTRAADAICDKVGNAAGERLDCLDKARQAQLHCIEQVRAGLFATPAPPPPGTDQPGIGAVPPPPERPVATAPPEKLLPPVVTEKPTAAIPPDKPNVPPAPQTPAGPAAPAKNPVATAPPEKLLPPVVTEKPTAAIPPDKPSAPPAPQTPAGPAAPAKNPVATAPPETLRPPVVTEKPTAAIPPDKPNAPHAPQTPAGLAAPTSSATAANGPAISPNTGWVVSETTSPVDYSPLITAVMHVSDGLPDAPNALAIRCRGLRTELLVRTDGIWRAARGGEVAVSYQVDDQPLIRLSWSVSADGKSAGYQDDAIGLLRSLPEGARLKITVLDATGSSHEATFRLAGLDAIRKRIAAACKWAPAEKTSSGKR
jgi:hypothetical protein